MKKEKFIISHFDGDIVYESDLDISGWMGTERVAIYLLFMSNIRASATDEAIMIGSRRFYHPKNIYFILLLRNLLLLLVRRSHTPLPIAREHLQCVVVAIPSIHFSLTQSSLLTYRVNVPSKFAHGKMCVSLRTFAISSCWWWGGWGESMIVS